MDAQALIGVGLMIAAAIVWLRSRVSAPVQLDTGPPPKSPAEDKARAAIKSEGKAGRKEIAADLRGNDPAGDLADRANRGRR